MLVAQLKPDPNDPNLAAGPHGAARQHAARRCWPPTKRPRVSSAPRTTSRCGRSRSCRRATSRSRPICRSTRCRSRSASRAACGSGCKTTAGLKFAQTAIDRLCFYLAGRDDVANKLYELCLATGLGALVLPVEGATRWHELLPAASIQPVGFTDDEALLPVTLRSFQGYRLLQEYFSFPQRFRFFELTGPGARAQARRRRTSSSW